MIAVGHTIRGHEFSALLLMRVEDLLDLLPLSWVYSGLEILFHLHAVSLFLHEDCLLFCFFLPLLGLRIDHFLQH